MIDLAKAMTLSAASRRFPGRFGGTAHVSSASRWASHGVKTPDGRILKLETVRIGSSVFLTEEALERFLAALNPAPTGETEEKPRTPAQTRTATDRAVRELELMGA